MRGLIQRIWKGEAQWVRWFLYVPLFCLSRIYKACIGVRDYLYTRGLLKVDHVSIPVVSVGNVTLGGTGKTPVAERLAIGLKAMGFRPGIITRGYKRKRAGTFCVDARNDSAEDVGDEAFMLASRGQIPVIVGTRRADAVMEGMQKASIDIAILDDGFQVRNMKKDAEILVVKWQDGVASREFFPLGPYRESWQRLRDADAILVNTGRVAVDWKAYPDGIPTFKMTYRPVHLYNMKYHLMAHFNLLRGRKVLAFAGLGDNRSFFDLLQRLGAEILREISYDDHYRYTVRDLEDLASQKDVSLVVTTEKDAVKLRGMNVPENLFYLSVEVALENEEELFTLICKKLEASGAILPDPGKGARRHWVQ